MATDSPDVQPFCRAGLDLAGLKSSRHTTFESFLLTWQQASSESEAYALLDHLPHLQLSVASTRFGGETNYYCDDGFTAGQKLEFLCEVASPLADWESQSDLLRLQREALRSIGVILNKHGKDQSLISKANHITVTRLVACIEAWRGSHLFGNEGATRGYYAMIETCDRLLGQMMSTEWQWEWYTDRPKWALRQDQEKLAGFFGTRQSLVNLELSLGRLHAFDYREILRPTAEAVASYILFTMPDIAGAIPDNPWEPIITPEFTQYQAILRLKAYEAEDKERQEIQSQYELLEGFGRIIQRVQVNEAMLSLHRTE